MSLPRTTYVWVFLLVLTLLAPRLLMPKAPLVQAAGLSSSEFARYVAAETQTRAGIALKTFSDRSLMEAREAYATLAKTTDKPNMPRRVLILDALQKKPIDAAMLKRMEAREQPLWQALYGKSPLPADAEARVREMQIGLLEEQALADVARKQGRTAQAAAYEQSLQARAQSSVLQQGGITLLMFGAGLIGVGVLLYGGIQAALGRWSALGRVVDEKKPEALPSAALLVDVFLCYLALYRGTGLLMSLLVPAATMDALSLTGRLGVNALVQVGTGVVALLYLRGRGVTLRQLGLHTDRLGSNILYGIATYCVALPLVLGLGAIARAIFHESSAATPNPMLPMLTAHHDFFGRFLIFSMVSLAAPFFEEVFFRGTLFTGLRQRQAFLAAAALSGVVFAMLHPMADWLPIFGLGFAFACARELRQSLVPCLVAHFLQNTMSFVLLTLLFR